MSDTPPTTTPPADLPQQCEWGFCGNPAAQWMWDEDGQQWMATCWCCASSGYRDLLVELLTNFDPHHTAWEAKHPRSVSGEDLARRMKEVLGLPPDWDEEPVRADVV